jgi:hypothetical protein
MPAAIVHVNVRAFPMRTSHRRLALALTPALLWMAVAGCSQPKADPSEAVVSEGEKLFKGYYDGDVAQARRSLQAQIRLIENSRVVYPPRQAAVLWITCSRLYVLETRTGDEIASQLALTKARYWNLRRYELEGALAGKELQEYLSFTPERITEMVDGLDKYHTGGRGPKYLDEKHAANDKRGL